MSKTKANKKPTLAQCEAQSKALAKLKPKVLRSSAFGDDHHAAIDMQIRVLDERMTEDEVYDAQSVEDLPDNVADAAIEAVRFRNGEAKEDLVTGWKELVR